MKPVALLAASLALLSAACTIQPENGKVDAQFHPPLVASSPQWHSEHYTMANGIRVCALSSGYNGLMLSLGRTQGGIDVVVSGNRRMQPGATLSVNVNGKHFETYERFFPAGRGALLAEELRKGGLAYLEWSEFSGPVGRERTHIQNIIHLDDLPAQYDACKASL